MHTPEKEAQKNSDIAIHHKDTLQQLDSLGPETRSALTIVHAVLEKQGEAFPLATLTDELSRQQIVTIARHLTAAGLLQKADAEKIGRKTYVRATPNLPIFAAKYNLFQWHLIHSIMAGSNTAITRRDILQAGLAGFAAMSTPGLTIKPDDNLNHVIGTLSERAKLHRENIVDRALGMYAVREGIAVRLKKQQGILVRSAS